MTQLELFAIPSAPPAGPVVPTMAFVRARLNAILDPLRAASAPIWSARELAKFKVIVPQMAGWLPPEERDAVRQEFARLVAALASPSD